MGPREYKLMTYTGMVILASGLTALLNDAILSGSIAIGIGSIMIMGAILGSDWHD